MAATFASASGWTFSPLETTGPAMVWIIVLSFIFAECAFIIGLFLPGDSLLLTAGIVLAHGGLDKHAWGLSIATMIVATAGNQLGYYIGRKMGVRLLARSGGKVLNAENLERAKLFLDRWGFWAIVAARWLPWIRTLAPLIAGAARMHYRRFLVATMVGAMGWVPVLILIGYYAADLLDKYPWLRTIAALGAIFFFVVGTSYGLWRYRQEIRRPLEEPERVHID